MIERENTGELMGQYTLEDLLPSSGGACAATPPEGYDAEGKLLNLDYPPVDGGGTTSSVSPDALPPSPKALKDSLRVEEGKDAEAVPPKPSPGASAEAGEGGAAQAVTDEVVPLNAHTSTPAETEAQTSADDAARLTALATEINAITEQTRGVVISAALAVGKRLIEAKSICPEGRFGEWLASAVSYSERKAQDMMRLYLEYGRDGSIPDSIAALDYSKAVALLSAPAGQREALAEQAQADDLSVRQLQQEIRRLREEAASAQQTMFSQEEELKKAWKYMDDLNKEHADTVAHLNASRDVNEQMEAEHQAAIDAKEAELKETKRVLADAAEKVSVAQAKTAAAEAAAEQLKRLRAEAEDRADQNAQRYGDALRRANDTAKQLAEAKAKIAAMEEAAVANVEAEPVRIEVIPEETQRELEQLRRDLAEARANVAAASTPTSSQAATAAEKFKWFYANQMQPTFKTALTLLRAVAQEDGHAADAFATALTNACKVMLNQLGSGERD